MSKYLKETPNPIREFLCEGFFKTKKGIIFTVVVAAIVLGGLGGGYGIWHYNQPKFQDVTVELGTQSVSIAQFMTKYANINKVGFVSDISLIDLSKTGRTELTLRHGSREETIVFQVEDTTAPEATFLTTLDKADEYVPNAADFVESVTDADKTTISFAQDVVIPEDYSDTTVTVVVTDASGNAVEQECTLHFGRIHTRVMLEYGQVLTKEHILLSPQKDQALISDQQIAEINAAGPGEYIIELAVDGEEESCTVTVQDTIAPQLEVQPLVIEPGDKVKLKDFVTHVSDYSGGVSMNFKTEPNNELEGEQEIVIEAVDLYGNVAVAQTTLLVTEDDKAPKISFDYDYVQAYCGGEKPNYMIGVTALDEVDGVCTVVYDDSDVNLEEVGTYEVVYTATDRAGNSTKKTRDVEVAFNYFDGNISPETQAILEKHAAKLSDDPEEIRDYVREKIRYNTNWGGDDPIAYGFKNRKGNCYVHALCLKALLDMKGYETQLIWVENHTHYWLVIKLGDVWRHIDATPSRGYHNRYSLMTDEQRYETLKGRDWDRELWPACE